MARSSGFPSNAVLQSGSRPSPQRSGSQSVHPEDSAADTEQTFPEIQKRLGRETVEDVQRPSPSVEDKGGGAVNAQSEPRNAATVPVVRKKETARQTAPSAQVSVCCHT